MTRDEFHEMKIEAADELHDYLEPSHGVDAHEQRKGFEKGADWAYGVLEKHTRDIERTYLMDGQEPLEKSQEAAHYNYLDDKIEALEQKLAVAVECLSSCKGAMTYAYEDHSDEYYLNVKTYIEKTIDEIKTK